MVGGHYTLQLRNHGNFVGEAAGRPIPDSVFGNYPEIFGPALDPADARRTARQLPTAQAPRLRRLYELVGPVRFARPRTYLARELGHGLQPHGDAAADGRGLARNPVPTVNINPAVRQTIFFEERGGNSFKGYGVVDFAATYTVPVWRPWPRG